MWKRVLRRLCHFSVTHSLCVGDLFLRGGTTLLYSPVTWHHPLPPAVSVLLHGLWKCYSGFSNLENNGKILFCLPDNAWTDASPLCPGGCSQASAGSKQWSCSCNLTTKVAPSWSGSQRQTKVRGGWFHSVSPVRNNCSYCLRKEKEYKHSWNKCLQIKDHETLGFIRFICALLLCSDGYSLSVLKRSNSSYLDCVKHYRIFQLHNGWIYISPGVTFPTVRHLVEHYSGSHQGW